MLRVTRKGPVTAHTILNFSFALSQIYDFGPSSGKMHVFAGA